MYSLAKKIRKMVHDLNNIETIKNQLSSAESRLRELDWERESLLSQIKLLRQELNKNIQEQTYSQSKNDTSVSIVNNLSSPEVKIALFRSLFRGREEVYPKRWENKSKGSSGYSPVCKNEWSPGLCNKPRIKCSECSNRIFLPVTDEVIQKHLEGKTTIGVYPLLMDETCWFLAVDFDKVTWREDVIAF